jgi:hypothetical protein
VHTAKKHPPRSYIYAQVDIHVYIYVVLRKKLIAYGEAASEAEAGAERAFHVAHESVGGMFPGEMEPVQIASFPVPRR